MSSRGGDRPDRAADAGLWHDYAWVVVAAALLVSLGLVVWWAL